jgi:hypothetical protein
MDHDDKQVFTHGVKNMVEQMYILQTNLRQHFPPEQTEKMLMVYWKASVASIFTPDIGDIVKKMMPRTEDDA